MHDTSSETSENGVDGDQSSRRLIRTSADFRTAPLSTSRMPPGIAYIVANECAERL